MNNNRRRNFRGRQQKNGFRRRAPSNHSSNGHFSNNLGNKSFNRNGSLSNPSSIEKVITKYQQLAKDAQSSGDPVLIAEVVRDLHKKEDSLEQQSYSERQIYLTALNRLSNEYAAVQNLEKKMAKNKLEELLNQ